MTHALKIHHLAGIVTRFFERSTAVILGFVMMVVGLALGVTLIMLPVGIVIGLLGAALFVGGLFANIDGPGR